MDPDLEWKLAYTKVHCETWSEMNLRKQGFTVVAPRVRSRSGFSPLFPRYLFVGHEPKRAIEVVRSTRGVLRLVQFGEGPVRVPKDVVEEVRSRMDAYGVVHLSETEPHRPLFGRGERERLRTLVKLAEAGFRVREAS